MKKWRRGNGIKLTASLRRSEFSCPGKRRQQVTPLIVAEIRWFKSPTAKQTGKNKVSRMHVHVQMAETNEKTQVIIARRIHN
jgi:hypothetical protein